MRMQWQSQNRPSVIVEQTLKPPNSMKSLLRLKHTKRNFRQRIFPTGNFPHRQRTTAGHEFSRTPVLIFPPFVVPSALEDEISSDASFGPPSYMFHASAVFGKTGGAGKTRGNGSYRTKLFGRPTAFLSNSKRCQESFE
ncbi:hypothetical protein O181_007017 [Austropuccinia psidii MF-1]|uniref:Uncharacterized protein n=1 Tax=Austropuccinia psidii MF-1 TaxID=1389203 RepID=A0A9Q3BL44_9BASI|nr:hypothetical protein [Austropuccinia psidii MF-1]